MIRVLNVVAGTEWRIVRCCLRTVKHLETIFCTWVRITRSASMKITHWLNWVDRGPVDEQWRPGQLVLASHRRTPQKNFSYVRIKLKSVRLHPTGYSTGAGSELGRECIDVRGTARARDLCVVGIWVRCQTMAFDQSNQAIRDTNQQVLEHWPQPHKVIHWPCPTCPVFTH